MKIYSSIQIRKADEFTILNEPISSVALMERASTQVYNWLINKYTQNTVFTVFCGVGNNGGDGLVLARLLHEKGYLVNVIEVRFSTNHSVDYLENKKRIEFLKIPIDVLNSNYDFESLTIGNIIIDAVFGSGLTRIVDGWIAQLINKLNVLKKTRIAIDIASGLFTENNDENNGVIFKPHYTLSFQFWKLAFLFPENIEYVGEVVILPIGISEDFILHEFTNNFTIEKITAKLIHKKSKKFDYKNVYGHALLVGGSYAKMGAIILASKAALKSGAGLVTAHIPNSGNHTLQVAIPEVMTIPDQNAQVISQVSDVKGFSAIGIGPGMGTAKETEKSFLGLIEKGTQPMVIDADALNLLSLHKKWLSKLPNGSILTPHLGELKRLVTVENIPLKRLILTKDFSKKYNVFVIIKGANTAIVCPDGEVFFNLRGNPGMATAGSGDVLTGVLTSLLAQGYAPKQAAILGVYVHGCAGDMARKTESRESLIASDIIDNLGKAFKELD